jgi:hypothetical protein
VAAGSPDVKVILEGMIHRGDEYSSSLGVTDVTNIQKIGRITTIVAQIKINVTAR